MNDRLSTPFTWFHKFGSPLLGILVVGTFLFRREFDDIPSGVKVLVLIVVMLGLGFTFWMSWTIKVVELDGNQLRVSDYFREETIPITSILGVDEMRFFGHRIKIVLLEPCRFGDTIVFIPATRFHLPLSDHPVVVQLRELVEKSIQGQSQL